MFSSSTHELVSLGAAMRFASGSFDLLGLSIENELHGILESELGMTE